MANWEKNKRFGGDSNMTEIIHLSEDNFDTVISEGWTLVDFWAEWCVPCKVIDNVIKELIPIYKDKLKFAKVNVDFAANIARRYNIFSIPTVILFKDGTPIDQMIGAMPKNAFLSFLKRNGL